jgi:hypothetical protein
VGLLNHYPDLTDHELAVLVEEFPRLPILDHALMTSDDGLAKKLDAFRRDHRRKLNIEWGPLLVYLVIPAVVTGFFLWSILTPLLAL